MSEPLTISVPDAPLLEIGVQWLSATARLEVCGELDIATADLLVEAAGRVLADGCERLVLSCEHLEFVDTGGLRGLIRVRAACAARGADAHLVEVGPQLERLLVALHLTRLFD